MEFVWKRSSFEGDKHWQYLSYLSHKACFALFTRLPGTPWRRMPSDIWHRPRGLLVPLGLLVQVPYCLSFLAAWNFHFATGTEQVLWRVSAIYHAFYSLMITGYYIFWLDCSKIVESVPFLARLAWLPRHRQGPSVIAMRSPYRHAGDAEHGYSVTLSATAPQSTKTNVQHWKTGIEAWLSHWSNLSPQQDPEQTVSLRWTLTLFLLTVVYIFSHLYIYLEDFAALRSQPADVYLTTHQFFPLIG